jgi:hypothetical protein
MRCRVFGFTLSTGLERAMGSPEVVTEAEEVWTEIWAWTGTSVCVSIESGREGLDLYRPDVTEVGPVTVLSLSVPRLLYP